MSQNSDQETPRPSLDHSHSRKLEITDAQSVIGWLHICKGDWTLYTSFGQTDSFLLISGRQSQKCIVHLFQQHDFEVREHLALNCLHSRLVTYQKNLKHNQKGNPTEDTRNCEAGEILYQVRMGKHSALKLHQPLFSCINRELHFDKFAPIFFFFFK